MAGNRSKAAIGIDLGTTYSCVAIWQHGNVEIITNDQGNRITPSCVAFTATDHLIGDAAQNQCHSNPTNTIFGVKRLIGRKYRDASVQNQIKLLPFKLEAGEGDKPQIVVQYKGETKRFCAEEISSMILAKMRTIAETFLGATVTDAVITVPAYFNDAQRRATKDAGHIAGLNVMRIINEPTAAAVAYGLDKSVGGGCGKNVLIFDLGGGTFDVSILWMEGSVLEVKATAGDTYLGGEDFDERMVRYLVEEFKKKNDGKDVSDSPKALRRLRTACEKAKRMLSSSTEALVEVDYLYAGIDFVHTFTRAKFEELNMDMFEKCMDVVRQCLKDAEMEESSIDNVVLVGGSTRIPKVQQLLQDLFRGKELSRSISPDEAVAYGAAVQAAKLAGEDTEGLHDLVLLDVTPLSLGTAILGVIMSVIIPKNTPIPAKRTETYVTMCDNQTAVNVDIYEGERAFVMQNNLLGEFLFGGLPAAPAGQAKVTVSFSVDADSILTVIAEDEQSGAKKEVTIVNERDRLSAEQIDRMIEGAERYRVEDEERKEKAASRSLLEAFIYNMRNRIRRGSLGIEVSAAMERILKDKLDTVRRWLEDHPDAEASELERRRKELEMVFGNLQGLSSLMECLHI